MTVQHPKLVASEAAVPGRLAFLDALRGVAALTVFLSHAAERVSPFLQNIVHTRFDLGHFGVTLFFMCSGFIIPFSLERQRSLRSFWISRIFRLYPLYWLTIGISIALEFATSDSGSLMAFIARNSRMILGNLTMLQMFMGISHIRGEYWTLSFEMLFYIVMTVLFVLRMHWRTLQLTVGLIVMSLVVEAILPLMLGAQFPVGILSFLALMCMGTILYRVHSGELATRTAAVVLTLGFIMLLIAPLAKGASEGNVWEYLNLTSSRLAAVLVFVMVFAVRSRTPYRFMVYMGTLSYSLYLMQTYIMMVNVGHPILNVLAWFTLQLVVATATYYWIERPGINCGRWLNGSLRSLRVSSMPLVLPVKQALPPVSQAGTQGADRSAEPLQR
jgi:peptidoglycan/LPS O-acetylase OafA/YrhL